MAANSSAIWTRDEDKLFECALAIYDNESCPRRWENIVRYIGGTKTVDEVKYHFQLLVDDLNDIEAGRIPFPNYVDDISDHNETEPAAAQSSKKRVDEKCKGVVYDETPSESHEGSERIEVNVSVDNDVNAFIRYKGMWFWPTTLRACGVFARWSLSVVPSSPLALWAGCPSLLRFVRLWITGKKIQLNRTSGGLHVPLYRYGIASGIEADSASAASCRTGKIQYVVLHVPPLLRSFPILIVKHHEQQDVEVRNSM
ncbi:hypothetical protein QQ045_003204 [Rhodiola kirilowii]